MGEGIMGTINVALAGYGWWGRKMMAVVQGRSGLLRFTHVADPALGDGAELPAGVARCRDLEAALADPGVEAVVLATPHELHEQQVLACAAAGRHVFCEKPLALTRRAALRMVAACTEAGVVLGMGHERRFEPPLAALLRDADSGRLGRLLQIEANFSHDKFLGLDPGNWRLDRRHAPVGGMTATGIHLTDMAIRLMGPAQDVRVACENLVSKLPSGDTMSAHIRFRRGGSAYVSASLGMPFVSRFAVYGSEGWVEVRDKAHLEAPEGWVVISAGKGGPIRTTEVPPAEPVRDNLEAFAKAVRAGGGYPVTGPEMIANIALLEAMTRSAETGAVELVEG